jgi:hypothetical protein
MSSRNFQKPIRIKGKKLVLTKKMIEDAQSQTKSNMAAARWLSVSYLTYRKYAKMYGLFERHLNPSGVGIKKGYGRWIKSLDQILDGSKRYRMRAGYVTNNTLENLRLLCPNCYLSHNGHMPSSERFYK